MENEIVKKVLVDENGKEMSIDTRFVVRKMMVERNVRVPLYVGNQLKSEAELAELGLTIKGYTREELDRKYCAELYAANPDLAVRVREYKEYMDTLGLPYDAKTDDIETAVYALDMPDPDKQNLVLKIKITFDNITLNLEVFGAGFSSFSAWEKMPILIKYLPEI